MRKGSARRGVAETFHDGELSSRSGGDHLLLDRVVDLGRQVLTDVKGRKHMSELAADFEADDPPSWKAQGRKPSSGFESRASKERSSW
jgi:hypothetical protein